MPEPKGDVTLGHYGRCGCGGLIVSKTWDPDQVVPIYVCIACGGEFYEEDLDEEGEEAAAEQEISGKDAYLRDGGSYCPFCKDHDILGDSIDIMTGSAYQHVHCSACGATWCDIYKLVDVETVHAPRVQDVSMPSGS